MPGVRQKNWSSFFRKKDWENYRVQIHAAKSVLRTLGAVALSEKAKELEFAAKNGDEEYILNNHAAMMEYYLKLADKITPPCR